MLHFHIQKICSFHGRHLYDDCVCYQFSFTKHKVFIPFYLQADIYGNNVHVTMFNRFA